ncbi:soluble lamin-associated protein of 75 kDa isoform X2 [Astyanax mexicanus]|uniref:Soluble lamin-associated protein of 75 kDa isoform X2 n=2 Tax=Astyanax mexicanus TaxID=7994 RepID=A0A8T2L2Y5_ASTMX|nr:soluble lamin-associated protein of 75 kDa isoform X2 [Astyanax mexicanus]
MEFPVDVLEAIGHEELESSAHSYMSDLLYVDPDHSQYLSLTTGRKVRISLSNVGFVPLYGANLKHKVLALFAPEDQFTAVALLLDDKWYAVDDILRTADSSREGLIKVRSVGERIVLYVLNRIVYRTSEMSAGEVPFLCHGENDFAKILWKNGEAVGFYSVKPKGSLCSNFVSQCYLLPVMDSIFVRRGHRGQGHGLQMLEDFVDSFKDDELGMKFPLSPAMSQVCRHYLDRYPADVDLLWEVEGVGGPYQRTRVASKLSTHTLKGRLLSCGKDDSRNGQTTPDKMEMTEETSLDITEEIIVVNKRLKVAEEMDDTPISTRTRSSEHKWKKRMREEKEETEEESQPEKISRVEEPEPVFTPAAVTLEGEGGDAGKEAEDLTPADGAGEETVGTEAPAVELESVEQALEVNGKLAEEQQEEEEEDAAGKEAQGNKEAGPALQNGTSGEEEEGMEVEERVEEKDGMDTVDTPEEAATEDLKEEGEEKLEEEASPEAEEHQEEVVSPAAEEEGADENKLEEDTPPAAEEEQKVDGISVSEEKEVKEKEEEETELSEEKKDVAPVDEEELDAAAEAADECEVAPEAEEKQEVAPEAEEIQEGEALEAEEKQEVAPEAEEKQEVAPEAEEKQEVAPELEERQEVAPEVEEKKEIAPEVEERQEVAPEVEEKKEIAPEVEERQEVAPEVEENQEVATEMEDKQTATPEAEEIQEAAPEVTKKQEAASSDDKANETELPPAEENVEEPADVPSEAQGQEEVMETEETPVEQEVVMEASEELPKDEGNQPATEGGNISLEEQGGDEENVSAVEEDECREDSSPAPDVRVLRGGRSKPVPSTPKRSSKRLSRKEVLTEDEEKEEEKMMIDEEKAAEDKEMAPAEEEKVTAEEEEAEHSSEEEEEPPVIDRRVLRGKIKVVQTTSQPRAKRRSRI